MAALLPTRPPCRVAPNEAARVSTAVEAAGVRAAGGPGIASADTGGPSTDRYPRRAAVREIEVMPTAQPLA